MNRRYLADRRQSAIMFAAIWTLYAIIYMTKNCYSAAMASIVSEGILSKSQTGAISAVFYLVYAGFQVIGGAAADRFSPGKLIFIGVLGAAVANLVIYFNQNYIVMMVTWALNAAVQFGVWPSIFKIVSSVLAREHRSRGIFYITVASSAGLFASYLCAAFVHRWQSNFLISALLLFVLSFAWLIFWRVIEGKMVEAAPEQLRTEGTSKEKGKGFWKLMLTSGVFLLLFAAVIRSMLDSGIKTLAPVMLMESYESVPASLATGLNAGLITACTVLCFLLVKLLYPRKIRDDVVFMTAVFVAALPLLLLLSTVGRVPVWMIVIVLVLTGTLVSAPAYSWQYLSARFEKRGREGTVSGITNAAASLGIVMANYALALAAERLGWKNSIFMWAIMCAAAILLCAVSLPLWKRFMRSEWGEFTVLAKKPEEKEASFGKKAVSNSKARRTWRD